MTSDGARAADLDTLLASTGWLRALALRILDDQDDADDVVQDTLTAALRRPPQADVPLRPWLARVARNLAFRTIRTRERRRSRDAAATPRAPEPPPDSALLRAEAFRALAEAVVALDAPYREVIVLRFLDALPIGEVAKRLGVPVETARTRLRRALAMLRDRLDRDRGGARSVALVLLGGWEHRGTPVGSTSSATGIAMRRTSVAFGGGIVASAMAVKMTAVALVLAAGVVTWLWLGERQSGSVARDAAARGTSVERTEDHAGRLARVAATEPAAAPAAPATAVPAGSRIRGRVVGPGDSSCAGASVAVLPQLSVPMGAPAPDARVATADAEGRFDLAVHANAPCFRVVATDSTGAFGAIENVAMGADVVVRVAPGETLSGTVRDAGGRPVGGASVVWHCPTGAGARLSRTARTDSAGRYRIAGLPTRDQLRRLEFVTWDAVVSVRAEGFAPSVARWGADATRAVDRTLDFWLSGGTTVEGRVLDGTTGAPIRGARVAAVAFGAGSDVSGFVPSASTYRIAPLCETTSDADGKFVLEHLPANGVQTYGSQGGGRRGSIASYVAAVAPGYVQSGDEVPLGEDGAHVSAEIRLWRSTRIEGRVLDAHGAPVEGACVSEFAMERLRGSAVPGLERPPQYDARTDAQGRYRIENVATRGDGPAKTTVYADASGRPGNPQGVRPSVEVELRAGETVQAKDIVLSSSGVSALIVRVFDSDGNPVWGAQVSRMEMPAEATTGRDGRARIEAWTPTPGYAPRPLRLIVRARGFASGATDFVTPSIDNPPEAVVRLGRPHRVAGRVVHEDGSPAGGTMVRVGNGAVDAATYVDLRPNQIDVSDPHLPALVEYAITTAADDGAFAAEDLPNGPYLVAGGGAAHAMSVVSDANDVVFQVPNAPADAAVALETRIRETGTGVPVLRASLQLFRDGKSLFGTVRLPEPDGSGTWRWKGLAPGSYQLRVYASGFVRATTDVVITGDAVTQSEVPLDRGVTLRGTVSVPPDGRVEDVMISLQPVPSTDDAGWLQMGARPNADGTFSLRGVGIGSWRVLAFGPNTSNAFTAAEPVEVVVQPGDVEARADVRAVRPGHLFVQVKGAPEGSVVIRDQHGREAASFALVREVTGGYDRELPPGNYVVELHAAGRDSATQQVSIEVGHPARVTFDVENR
jgi:RNA polymerase sigma-70 factor (ECF subfamily)